MAVNNGDFITLTYTGKLEDGTIFDTTDEQTAKTHGLHNPQASYGPVTICVGEGHILRGLDDALVGATVGEHTIVLPAENAFGKKSTKLIQLVPTAKFKQQGVQVHPGLQVNIDGQIGIIRRVSGGRTLVDFNHPLAGQQVAYDVSITKIVEDDGEKVDAVAKMMFGPHAKGQMTDGTATIETATDIPEQFRPELDEKIKSLVDTVKNVEYKKTAQGVKASARQMQQGGNA